MLPIHFGKIPLSPPGGGVGPPPLPLSSFSTGGKFGSSRCVGRGPLSLNLQLSSFFSPCEKAMRANFLTAHLFCEEGPPPLQRSVCISFPLQAELFLPPTYLLFCVSGSRENQLRHTLPKLLEPAPKPRPGFSTLPQPSVSRFPSAFPAINAKVSSSLPSFFPPPLP